MTDFKYPGRGGPSVDDIVKGLEVGDRVWLDLDPHRPDCGYCSDEARGYVAGVADGAVYMGSVMKSGGSELMVVDPKPYRIDDICDICVIPYQVVLEPPQREELARLDAFNKQPPEPRLDIYKGQWPMGLFGDEEYVCW